MATLTIPIATKIYKVGTTTIPAQTVPVGSTLLTVTLTTANWTNPASSLLVEMELSLDGGVTWMGGGAGDAQCEADGTFRDRDGTILPTTVMSWSWPANTTHIRGTFTVSGASINTGGTVEIS